MEIDEIPELPKINKEELFEVEVTFEEFSNARNRIIMYEIDGEYRIGFDELNSELFACLVAKFSQPLYDRLWEFLKLSCESIRLIKKQNKNSFKTAIRIEGYINNRKINKE